MITPEDVLSYWIGDTATSTGQLKEKNKLWFTKSFETDEEIARRFTDVIGALAAGLAADWANRGARGRLAAIIALDQFSRNIFRGHRYSFMHDPLSRHLMQVGLDLGQDRTLSEPERVFFYLPAEHSEKMADQNLSVSLFEKLSEEAREDYREFCKATLDYAYKHREVIERFGRFPHRNELLQRTSTPAEEKYLAQPGAGF
ncbi:DUF924 domain-containing protein [Henriciella barbarensis]|uniref:DUF924 domain-containing protein n=1 Tax=Henriciella barbarensis TaxID=86342 RepID=A0A399QYQ4_9PROT|nr:DUF924 family protein [Henriciella barbarensis]RIJ23661.1 DUF924 domain-containing protein [Henriciella barbarensis]